MVLGEPLLLSRSMLAIVVVYYWGEGEEGLGRAESKPSVISERFIGDGALA